MCLCQRTDVKGVFGARQLSPWLSAQLKSCCRLDVWFTWKTKSLPQSRCQWAWDVCPHCIPANSRPRRGRRVDGGMAGAWAGPAPLRFCPSPAAVQPCLGPAPQLWPDRDRPWGRVGTVLQREAAMI